MTDPASSSPAPAGWYADPAGSADQRYWDGARWTEQLRSPEASAPPAEQRSTDSTLQAPASRPEGATAGTVSSDTRVDTPWAWAIALLPLASLLAIAAFDLRGYLVDIVRITLSEPAPGTIPELPGLGGSLLVSLVAFLVTAGTIVFAFLDWRALRARGIVRPFHWAWSFFALAGSALGALVYLIGRSVVVFRQTRRGLAPLWVLIAVVLLSLIVVIVKYVDALSALEGILPGVTGLS